MGVRTQVSGEELQCYDLEGFKGLLKLDAELEGMLRLHTLLDNKVQQLEFILSNQESMLKNKSVSVVLLQNENERISNLWKQENKLRHEAENKPQAGAWLGWGLASMATFVAVVLGVTLAVK